MMLMYSLSSILHEKGEIALKLKIFTILLACGAAVVCYFFGKSKGYDKGYAEAKEEIDEEEPEYSEGEEYNAIS